jgi:hypothetical protein
MSGPSTDWKEQIAPNEDARLERLAEELREVQRKNAQNGKTARGLHAKANLGVEATFEVKSGLPAHAAQGLFATPKKYGALVRFSNGSGRSQSDRTGDVRGIAIKVIGVDGKKIIPGLEDKKTQDFLLIHFPSQPFRDAGEFVSLVVAASGNQLLLLPRLAGRIGFGRAFGLVRTMLGALGKPFPTFAGRRMYSVLPVKMGDYAARLTLVPVGEPAAMPAPQGNDSLGDDLKRRLAAGALEWDLCAQFFVDEKSTPIEDATVEWSEAAAPLVPLARLTIAKHDPASDRAKKIQETIETLSFDPWHALVEHRPLGHLMRARNHAYRLSTIERKAAPEPDTMP